MPSFSFFTTLANRALTGKPLTQKAKKLLLDLLREKACLASVNADSVAESLYYVDIAAQSHCPYSNFVLACLYLGPERRKPEKTPHSPEWYNLFNGCIHQRYMEDTQQELINLTLLEQVIKPDLKKAIFYFKTAAQLKNPQALLWLSRLSLLPSPSEHLADWLITAYFAEMAVSLIQSELELLMHQFDLQEIVYLCVWIPSLAKKLLSNESFVQFLLDSEDRGEQGQTNLLYRLLTVSPEVAIKFLKDEQFLARLGPYQKAEMLHHVLEEFPELQDELRQAFCHKRPKY